MDRIESLIRDDHLQIQNIYEEEFDITDNEKDKYIFWSNNWAKCLLNITEDQLKKSIYFIFEKEDIATILKIDKKCIYSFIKTVLYYYLPNPFHNSNHAVEILYSGYMIFKKLEKYNITSKLEQISLFLSLFLHDIGHLGYTSKYLYDNNILLKEKFGLDSLSERMHIFIANRILLDKKIGLFKNLKKEEEIIALTIIKDCIMATDIYKQNEILDTFKKKYFKVKFSKYERYTGVIKEIGRIEFLFIIKIADLINLTKSRIISYCSAYLIKEELSIEVYDPSFIINVDKEIEFFKKIALPLFKLFCMVFKDVNIIYKNSRKNYVSYKNFSKASKI